MSEAKELYQWARDELEKVNKEKVATLAQLLELNGYAEALDMIMTRVEEMEVKK